MPERDPQLDRVADLAVRYLDGLSTAEEFAELSRLIKADAAAARLFNDLTLNARTLVEANVSRDAADLATPVLGPAPHAAPASPSPYKSRAAAQRSPGVAARFRIDRSVYAIAAALLLAAAAVTAFLATRPGESTDIIDPAADRPLAVMLTTDNVVWTSDPVDAGQELGSRAVRIESGAVTLELLGGANVHIAGPADVRLLGDHHAAVRYGSLRVTSTPGLVLELPHDVRLTDLGTEFTVDVDRAGLAVVEVLDGIVEIDHDGAARRLDATQAARVVDLADRVAVEVYRRPALVSDEALAELARQPEWIPIPRLDADALADAPILGRLRAAADRFGRPGRATRFDGRSLVDLQLAWPAGSYTAAAWVRPHRIDGAQYVIGVQNSGNNPGRFIRIDDGRPQVTHVIERIDGRPNNITTLYGPHLPAGEWTHLAAVFEGDDQRGTLTLYINGQTVAAQAVVGDSTRTESHPNLTLGARPDRRDPMQEGFFGDLGDPVLTARPMSPDEIGRLYAATRPER